MLFAMSSVARADDITPNFTFRRVSPPRADARKLITVQIEVQAPQDGGPGGDSLDLNFDGLKPLGAIDDLAPPSEEEFGRRWKALTGGGELPNETSANFGPSSANLRRLGQRYGPTVSAATRGTRVPPALVLAVMAVESAGRSDAVSRAGAAGLMQLMPATATRFAVGDRFDASESIRGGAEYLDFLMRDFDGDVLLALAGYNAGENAIKRYGGIPPYDETRAYVPKVVAAWRLATGLCHTREEAGACTRERIALAD
jgi:hypothetical protein